MVHDHTDPQYVGPGVWTAIHIEALYGPSDRKSFADFLKRQIDNFPCPNCRQHANEYIKHHPLPTNLQNDALFVWTWTFHNAVNHRLHKLKITLDEAYRLYRPGHTDCAQKCKDADDVEEYQQPQSPQKSHR